MEENHKKWAKKLNKEMDDNSEEEFTKMKPADSNIKSSKEDTIDDLVKKLEELKSNELKKSGLSDGISADETKSKEQVSYEKWAEKVMITDETKEQTIERWKKEELLDLNLIPSDNEPNTIIFNLDNKEYLKINKEGFFLKGKLIADDKSIYEEFLKFFKYSQYAMEPALKELIDLTKEKIEIDKQMQSPTTEKTDDSIINDHSEEIKLRAPWLMDWYGKNDKDMVRSHIGHIANSLVNILNLL